VKRQTKDSHFQSSVISFSLCNSLIEILGLKKPP